MDTSDSTGIVDDSMRVDEARESSPEIPTREVVDEKPDISAIREDEEGKPDLDSLEKSENESPAVVKPEKKLISIRLASQDGLDFSFKVSTNIRMEKVMNSYLERVDTPPGEVRFLYGGKRIKRDDTPASLEMEDDEDGPLVDVVTEKTGGFLA